MRFASKQQFSSKCKIECHHHHHPGQNLHFASVAVRRCVVVAVVAAVAAVAVVAVVAVGDAVEPDEDGCR